MGGSDPLRNDAEPGGIRYVLQRLRPATSGRCAKRIRAVGRPRACEDRRRGFAAAALRSRGAPETIRAPLFVYVMPDLFRHPRSLERQRRWQVGCRNKSGMTVGMVSDYLFSIPFKRIAPK